MPERKEIWNEGHENVWLWSFGEYPETSVLAGQPRHCRVEAYKNVAEAVAANPGLPVYDGKPEKPTVHIPEEPPSWFDPMDAGEAWGEDDY